MEVLLVTNTVPMAAQSNPDTVIITSATSEVPVTPDHAQASIGVQTQNADVKIAQQENTMKTDALIPSCRKLGSIGGTSRPPGIPSTWFMMIIVLDSDRIYGITRSPTP